MNNIQTAIELMKLPGKHFYVKCNPEILDFITGSGELLIYSPTKVAKLPITVPDLIQLLGLLSAGFFGEKEITLITWNIKNFFSFIRAHLRSRVEHACQILDLKPLEKFLGIEKDAPADFQEAMQRAKVVMTDPSWPQAKKIYQAIHTPLIFEVLPDLETLGICDSVTRKVLYSYYELEGQANGRLLCHEAYNNNSFIPHRIGPDERTRFRPRGVDELFMYFDFHNMEISMLQWLSQDERLQQILELDEDPYHVIFKLLTGGVCDNEKKREFCKRCVIGHIYGQSAKSLAEKAEISLQSAEIIINKLYKLFPSSLQWIKQRQDEAAGICVDYFGRRRLFESRHWGVRNFVVQSPASIICLEKLIDLHHSLKGYAKIACHIHDGYIVYVGKAVTKMVAAMGKEVLERESLLCPGLKLRLSCKVGATLAELNVFEG